MPDQEHRDQDEIPAFFEHMMRDIKSDTSETKSMVKDLGTDVAKIQGTVAELKDNAVEDRRSQRGTERKLAKVEERVDTIRAGAATDAGLAVVKDKGEWSLTPKQWAAVCCVVIPAGYGLVEIVLKIQRMIG